MPLNPRRVQAVFLEASDYVDPMGRAAFLDRECSNDPELRLRVESLLKAHDEFNSFLIQPFGAAGSAGRTRLLSDYRWRLRRRG
jgi:hypothetical protein